ncbi:H-type lectin domain-containing protein [Thalassovita sp.]|uniref:H-type lectin domain-containing protein n=1 Tax=Thalassovita sp. TaxID=1979401 RepID=UPI0028828058|nr:H-type lectin domain-containing protein [Thalassovita sp.]MDF1804605.1 H-type lectin domain-containing protein [Thalassovita sp.]
MKILNANLIAIAQGNTDLFEDFSTGGPMWAEQGNRERRVKVVFDTPFAEPPNIHCALSMWDVDYSTNVRGDIDTAKITKNGFEIVFRTWGNTRIARARANWMAIGRARDDDMWDV